MVLGMFAVRSLDETDDVMFPSPATGTNAIRFDAADGANVSRATATGITVSVSTDGKLDNVATVRGIKAALYVTDCRLAFACSKYDKGGGWVGGAMSLVLNAGSKILAAVRSGGTVLTGHVRYAWLHQVGGHEKEGFLDEEKLRVVVSRRVDGELRNVYLDFTLPSDVSGPAIAAEVVRRAAHYRLDAGESLDADVSGQLTGLTQVAPLASEKGRFAMHRMPGAWPVSAASADLRALLERKRAEDASALGSEGSE